MAEPLEDTRSELIFATEPVIASLSACIKASKRDVTPVELDEIEVGLALDKLHITMTHRSDYVDPKGHPPAMQSTLIFASICAIDSLQSQS
jgi:hypothetical protein